MSADTPARRTVAADDDVSQSIRELLESFVDATPRIAIAIAVVVVGYVVSRAVRAAARVLLRPRRPPSFTTVVSKFAGWVVLGLVLLAGATIAFPSVRPVDLLAGLGFFSIAIGFAFQDVLENTLAGILLLVRQPFETGDQIEVDDRSGTVEAITIRETRLRTFDGQLVLIPNRDVYKSVIRVQTFYPTRRLEFVVGIAYENDTEEACAVIATALGDVPGVATSPPPEALPVALGVSTVDIEARCWSSPGQHEAAVVLGRAIATVKRSLESAGIEMPADIIALQATPSFRAALQGDQEVTPGGGVVPHRDDR